MDDVDCKLDLLLALHQQNRLQSSDVKTAVPSTTSERQRSRSEACDEETGQTAAGSTTGRRRPLGRAETVPDASDTALSDVLTDGDGYDEEYVDDR